MSSSSLSGSETTSKKRVLPAFIIQGSKREKLAQELLEMGAANSLQQARIAAKGMFFALDL